MNLKEPSQVLFLPDVFWTNPESLSSLLQDIDDGKLVLPAFQRRFEWDNKRQDALLKSIINGYPAGSLLFLEQPANEEILGKRLINGVDPTNCVLHPSRIILDGQQRLTTLYHILFGRGDPHARRVMIDLEKTKTFRSADGELPASNDDQGQQLVNTSLIPTTKEKCESEYGTLELQFEKKVLPLNCTFGKQEITSTDGAIKHIGFSDWVSSYVESSEPDNKQERIALRNELEEIKRRFIDPINDYRFPVVVLTKNTGPDAVCRVFVDINIQQKPLDPFEVVAAKVWPYKIDLYRKWEDGIGTYPNVSFYRLSRVIPLQAISLIQTHELSKKDPEVRIRCTREALYEIQPKDFESLWNLTMESLDWCIGLLKGEAGVLHPRWLPYSAMLASMSASVTFLRRKSVSEASLKNKLLRWFWYSVFSETYSGGTNSQNASDFQILTNWMMGNPTPSAVQNFLSNFRSGRLRATTSSASGMYQGVMCLLLRRHARDFRTGQQINTNLFLKEEIDDHHVFPEAYLRKKKPKQERETIDCVLNRALIDAYTNRQFIRDNPPSIYLNEIEKQIGKGTLVNILKSQLLPTGSSLFQDDFERFLVEREQSIVKEIKQVTK